MRVFLTIIFLIITSLLTVTAFAKTYDAAISPDGKNYAVVRDINENKAIVFYELENRNKRPVAVLLEDFSSVNLYMAGNNIAIIRLGGLKRGVGTVRGQKALNFSRWLSINTKTGKNRILFNNEGGADFQYFLTQAGRLLGLNVGKKRDAYFSRTTIKTELLSPTRLKEGQDELVYSLLKINVANGRSERVSQGEPDTQAWVIDDNGDILGKLERETNGDYSIYGMIKNRLKLNGTIDVSERGIESIFVQGRNPNSKTVFTRIRYENHTAFQNIDLESGKIADHEYPFSNEINAIYYNPKKVAMHAIIYDGLENIYHFDDKDRALQTRLEKAIPGSSVLINDADTAREKFIVSAYTVSNAKQFYLFNRLEKTLEPIGD